ncbi:MAG: hypothetical protein HYV07_21835 [Deltaproteobacteria bacterium]|nr:hypothetical protein [Deltaproteobacteria bacterium]
MRGARRAAILLSALGCGEPPIYVPFAGEVAVFAIIDANGEITSAGRVTDDAFQRSLDAASVIIWSFRSSDLLESLDRPVDPDSVTVRRGSDREPASGCRRCIGLRGLPPFIVMPGESCAPPVAITPSVEGAEVAPEDLERLRAEIRIDVKGPCGCPTASPQADVSSLEVEPSDGHFPFERLAASPDGSMGFFGEHVIALRARDGQTQVRSESHIFEGAVLAAASSVAGEFLVAVADDLRPLTRQHVVGRSLESELEISTPELRVASIIGAPGTNTFVVSARRPAPDFGICGAPARDWRCSWLMPDGLASADAVDLRLRSGGRLIAYSETFLYELDFVPVFEPGLSTRITSGSGSNSAGVVTTSATTANFRVTPWPVDSRKLIRTTLVDRPGDLIAAFTLDEPIGSLTTIVSSRDTDAPRSFQTLTSLEGSSRESFELDGLAGFVVSRASAAGIERLVVLCDAAACQPPVPAESIFDVVVAPEAQATGAGWVFRAEGAALVRSGGAWRSLFGPMPRPRIAAIVPIDEGSLFLSLSGGHPSFIRHADGSTRSVDLAIPGTVVAAARGLGSSDVLAVGSFEGRGAIHRLDVADLTHRAIEVPASLDPGSFGLVAAIGPSSYLIAGGNRLLLLQRDELRPISVQWDDPATAELEDFDRAESELSFRALAGANGVGFATGSESVILKVDPQRLAASRVHAETAQALNFTAASAACADEVVVATDGNLAGNRESGRILRFTRGSADESPGSFRIEAPRLGQTNGQYAGYPFAVTGPLADPYLVFGSSVVAGATSFRLNGVNFTAAFERPTGLELGTIEGRSFVARIRRGP